MLHSTFLVRLNRMLYGALAGDEGCWNLLLADYRPYLTLEARRWLGRFPEARFDASDIVQKTLLSAHRDRGQLRGRSPGEFRAWILEVLRNNVRQALRDARAAKRDVDREARLETIDEARAAGSSPDQRLLQGEAIERLAFFLDQLPEDQREAVRLRHLEGWTMEALAAHFDRAETAVAGLVKRGVKRLRDLMLADEAEE